MTRETRRGAAVLAGLLWGCGGGGGPAAPPTPAPIPGHPVTAIVFYDKNGNGVQDPPDHAIPDVDVVIGGKTGRSVVGSGAAAVADVPAGSHQVLVRAESLPPFFGARVLPTVAVPAGGPVRVPLTLPIGNNRPGVLVAFFDCIT